ncbi:hypothetical protein KH5H1_22570 [Corallococcus caeni]|nr:hypothetical protein KH5H1_22570 [Corallococcus sp. KH5-1]
MKKPHERPSIGVLLCASKDDEVVEFALARTTSPTLVAEYLGLATCNDSPGSGNPATTSVGSPIMGTRRYSMLAATLVRHVYGNASTTV